MFFYIYDSDVILQVHLWDTTTGRSLIPRARKDLGSNAS